MKLIPKNWTTFQHYKDRCPPWIKLHRDLLNDYDFAQLPIEAKAIAPLMWLLASESKNGVIDLASEALAFRLHVASDVLASGLKSLIDKGFFIDASDMLAECYQDAIPETEIEREIEAETEAKTETFYNPSLNKDVEEKKYVEIVFNQAMKDGKDWARKLRDKELSGAHITPHNKRLWRQVLGAEK